MPPPARISALAVASDVMLPELCHRSGVSVATPLWRRQYAGQKVSRELASLSIAAASTPREKTDSGGPGKDGYPERGLPHPASGLSHC